MKKTFTALSAALLMVVLVSSSALAAGSTSKTLRCFTGGAAGCAIAADGSVVLTNITVGGTDYAGVYLNSKSTSAKPLSAVAFFSFNYDPNAVAGGAPRFSVPINDGLGTPGLYVFMDAQTCGNTGTVDANCPVFLNQAVAGSPLSWANWAAFATDPTTVTWRITSGGIPFIIADWPSSGSAQTYTIWNIVLR